MNGNLVKRSVLFFAFFLVLRGQGYWQQTLQYTMNITLQPEAAKIIGSSTIIYANNSPDTLTEIYLNLYPRAFRKGSVKYQEFKHQFGALSRAKDFITGSGKVMHDFTVQSVTVQQGPKTGNKYKIDDTIMEIFLPQPLLPHDSLTLALEWTHVNGEMFERAGKIDAQYNMAQWYPKPMVYDEHGWNVNPFHAEGEFYGEFATFDVTIDVPETYVVAATGVVLSGDPGWSAVQFDTSMNYTDWLAKYDSVKTVQDSLQRRRVTFHAENVHDFAWVASPNYIYEHGRIDGIDINVFYNKINGPKWNTVVLERTARTMEWLNTQFGRYPYPQVSVTDRLRGGGMEYPMLVMNGRESEGLIVHEIGHIWFYGILGNNEIDEAWLDEGFTSFQTRWYSANHYPPYGYDFKQYHLSPFREKHWRWVSDLHRAQWNAIRYQLSGLDEPVSRSSYLYNNGQAYRANVYTKASLMLYELKYILGDSLFTKAMREYYRRWQLKHVNEDRFIHTIEAVAQQDLDWFFKPWLHDTALLDYAIDSWKTERDGEYWKTTVLIERRGKRSLPVTVQLRSPDGGVAVSQRLPDYKWNFNHKLVFATPFKPQSVVLDPGSQTLDIDFRNNYGGRMPGEWLLDWANMNYVPRDRYIQTWFPHLDYHPSDGLMPGIKLSRAYAFWERTTIDLSYGLESARVYGRIEAQRKFKWSPPGTNYYLKALRYRGHEFGQIYINQRIPRSYYLPQISFGVGFAASQSTDSLAAPLFNEGTIAKTFLYSRIGTRSFSLYTRFETAAGGWSDWSFNKWYTQISYSVRRDKFNIKTLAFAGRYWSKEVLPRQEQFNVTGANAENRYAYPYTRHPDSFYGIAGFSNQIYIPGDGEIRGLTGKANVLADQIVTVNIDASYTVLNTPVKVVGSVFSGIGVMWSDPDLTATGDWVGAGGVSLAVQKNMWERPVSLRVDVPLWSVWQRSDSALDKSYQYLISFSRSL